MIPGHVLRLRTAVLIVVLTLAHAGAAGAADHSAARFEIAVDISWSAETAPYEFPADAHMSGLIGATHHARYVVFRDGLTASSGLELVTENGRASILKAEFAEAKRRRRLGTVIEGPALETAPGRITATFTTTRDHSLLSFVTMIAPSPDWFTGVADVELLKDGEWIEATQLPLWAWDAGTDSGDSYQADDSDTQPRQSTRLLATPHVLIDGGLVPIGTVQIRRLGQD